MDKLSSQRAAAQSVRVRAAPSIACLPEGSTDALPTANSTEPARIRPDHQSRLLSISAAHPIPFRPHLAHHGLPKPAATPARRRLAVSAKDSAGDRPATASAHGYKSRPGARLSSTPRSAPVLSLRLDDGRRLALASFALSCPLPRLVFHRIAASPIDVCSSSPPLPSSSRRFLGVARRRIGLDHGQESDSIGASGSIRFIWFASSVFLRVVPAYISSFDLDRSCSLVGCRI
jgi:hypothetical protein